MILIKFMDEPLTSVNEWVDGSESVYFKIPPGAFCIPTVTFMTLCTHTLALAAGQFLRRTLSDLLGCRTPTDVFYVPV